jgi:hypothetical protein
LSIGELCYDFFSAAVEYTLCTSRRHQSFESAVYNCSLAKPWTLAEVEDSFLKSECLRVISMKRVAKATASAVCHEAVDKHLHEVEIFQAMHCLSKGHAGLATFA